MILKLRAWDDIAKEMYYSEQEQFDDMLGFRFKHFETDNPVYMLFTGLKDKSGIDIYKDDIVMKRAYNGEEYDLISLVVFDAGSFCLKCICGNEKSGEGFLHAFGDAKKEIVIGNCFKNPELLK